MNQPKNQDVKDREDFFKSLGNSHLILSDKTIEEYFSYYAGGLKHARSQYQEERKEMLQDMKFISMLPIHGYLNHDGYNKLNEIKKRWKL